MEIDTLIQNLEHIEEFAYNHKDLFLLYSKNQLRLINEKGKELLFLDSFEKDVIFACLECNCIFVVLCNGEICIYCTESSNNEILPPFWSSQAISASCFDETLSIVHADGFLISISCACPSSFKKWKLSGSILEAIPLHVWQTSSTSPTLYREAANLKGNTYLAVGSAPSIGIYHSPEWKPRISLHSALNSAFSFAKSFIPRKSSLPSPTGEKEKNFPSCTLNLQHFFDDSPRICTKILALNPKYALIADNFGRILLLDLKGCIVVRILKGFRDSFAWFSEKGEIFIASKQRNCIFQLPIHPSKSESQKTHKFPVSDWIKVQNTNVMFINRQTRQLFSIKPSG
jgi:hypothetical protein